MAQNKARLIFALALALGLLAGCQKRETAVQAGDRNQILEVGNYSEPTDLDPQIIDAQTDFNLVLCLMEGLTTPDPKDLHPTPAAAESWDISPDRTVYTFHLRPNAKWSDGTPVTAHDFLYSYKRMLSPKLGSEYSYMLYVVKNAKAYNTGALTDFDQVGFKAPDALTLEVTLNNPTPYFLSLVGHHSWFPVQQATIEKWGKMDERGTPWTRPGHYVGNGPFLLKEWKSNEVIRMVKSPTYWDAANTRLNGVNFYPIGSSDTEERAFRAGQLHVTLTIPIDRMDYYRKEHPELIHQSRFLASTFYRLNIAKPPLNDVRVRKALAMSIDREKIVRYVARRGLPAYSLAPPDTGQGYKPDKVVVEDVKAAQQLLADAGFPGGAGFPPVQLIFVTNEANQRVSEAIQAMWQTNLHINITLQNMEEKVFESENREMNYQMSDYGWAGDYNDPNTFLSLMVTGGGNNQTGWGNPEYDRLIDLAARTADPASRLHVFQQAENILVDQSPIIPLAFATRNNLRQPSVQGWYDNLLDIHPVKHVYLK